MSPPQFDEWPHGRVQLQDVSIHFRYAGSGPALLLVHGNPQHSLTWRLMGPILAEHFTIIAPDNRGMGDSSLPQSGVYTSEAMAGDLKGLVDFLKIKETVVFSFDKGCGPAAVLAFQHPDLVKAIGFCEYCLPGYGYEQFSAPQPNWDLYQNWQLAFFSVPDAAEFFIRDREKQMLSWYFWHASYSGNEAIPDEIVTRYAASISKPGFLRSMLGAFATYTIAADNKYFSETLKKKPLPMPVLSLGGEASIAPIAVLEQLWGSVGTNVVHDLIPKAGHWIADENPGWVAQRLIDFFEPSVKAMTTTLDLSWLENKVTMH